MQDIIFFISEHVFLSSIWCLLLMIVTWLIIKNWFIKCKFINNIQAIKLINEKNAIIIDTRAPEFFKQGHIVNSINIPLKSFLENIQKIESYKSMPIILIFDEESTCNIYVEKFIKYGFYHIHILSNGINCWNLDHLPLVMSDKKFS